MCPAVEVEVTRVIFLLREDNIARIVALLVESCDPIGCLPRLESRIVQHGAVLVGSTTLVLQSTLRPPWSRAYLGAGLGPSHILSLDGAPWKVSRVQLIYYVRKPPAPPQLTSKIQPTEPDPAPQDPKR